MTRTVGGGSGAGDPTPTWELPEDSATTPGASAAQQRITRRQVALDIRAAAPAAGRGTIPAGMRRWAEQTLTPPQVDWRTHLRAAIRRAISHTSGNSDYTYARPGRRRVPHIVTPAMRTPLAQVAVVVDTSGSMSPTDLAAALSEINAITTATRRRGFTLVTCDAEATLTRTVTNLSQVVLTGGGGTDMRVGIAAAQAATPKPDCIVTLTDGLTPWPAEQTSARLVIGLINPTLIDTPAWATTVHINPHDS